MNSNRLLALALSFMGVPVFSQQIDLNRLWREAPSIQVDAALSSIVAATSGTATPSGSYREFDLDRAMLRSILGAIAPKKPSSGGFLPFDVPLDTPSASRGQIAIPAPDGATLTFTIEDSNALSPGLQAKHPEMRTFRGISPKEPDASLRLEVTPSGVHALVRRAGRSFYVQPVKFDPQFLERNSRYASFSSERTLPSSPFKCDTPPQPKLAGQARLAALPDVHWGEAYRTYRLAVATTGYYTRAVGGTKAAALDALTQTVNRVDGIYEREFSIHLELIPDEDLLISTDPAADKLHNGTADVLIKESQVLIDRVIGDAQYDIGHTMSTGAGGLAQVGAVRQTGVKAVGVTGRKDPTGAVFDVDYVAHEMGHQFGANHTFNGRQGACGSNRNETTAYEPGSGSTILSYAGICDHDDVQGHSDGYFHGISVLEITDYVSGAGDTDRKLPTGLVAPAFRPVAAVALPVRTPFALVTALPGTNSNDAWTYTWEEFDLGPQADLGAADDGRIPLFRSVLPTADPMRVFTKGLPVRDRSSTFRVTARVVRASRGAQVSADLKVQFIAGAGPFVVIYPDGTALAHGATEVQWQVARTDDPPIRATDVQILLSTDGGKTFPTVLEAQAPNTGRARVTLSAAAAPVIVRVRAINNYFFADSPPTAVH